MVLTLCNQSEWLNCSCFHSSQYCLVSSCFHFLHRALSLLMCIITSSLYGTEATKSRRCLPNLILEFVTIHTKQRGSWIKNGENVISTACTVLSLTGLKHPLSHQSTAHDLHLPEGVVIICSLIVTTQGYLCMFSQHCVPRTCWKWKCTIRITAFFFATMVTYSETVCKRELPQAFTTHIQGHPIRCIYMFMVTPVKNVHSLSCKNTFKRSSWWNAKHDPQEPHS